MPGLPQNTCLPWLITSPACCKHNNLLLDTLHTSHDPSRHLHAAKHTQHSLLGHSAFSSSPFLSSHPFNSHNPSRHLHAANTHNIPCLDTLLFHLHVHLIHTIHHIICTQHSNTWLAVAWTSASCGLNITKVWTEMAEFLCTCSNQIGQDGAQTT